jgi:hypothetical protein
MKTDVPLRAREADDGHLVIFAGTGLKRCTAGASA